MIAIVNVSTHSKPWGIHEYELRINQKIIANFEHKREEGLAVCLQKAAIAAEKARWEEVSMMLGLFPTDNVKVTGAVSCEKETKR